MRPVQIVLIITDSQRKDMVGCYGLPQMITPNLDRLAADGVRYARAYTCQPVCSPARSALFTGLWPHSNGVWANSMGLSANVVTVAQRLSGHGILCGYIGKWHLDGSDYFGLGHAAPGWEPRTWYDMRNYLDELQPAERRLSRRPASNAGPGISDEFTFAHRCSDRAVDFVQRHTDDSYLLVVSYDEPHHPHLAPRRFRQPYESFAWNPHYRAYDDVASKPEHQRLWSLDAQRSGPAPGATVLDYLACNSFVDHEIGRVVAAIDAWAPGSLVIYTSDHGEFLGSHSLALKGPAMYEEITNIPLIVRWPGRAPAGAVSEQLASHIDITPTILDVFGLPAPRWCDGRSMRSSFMMPEVALNDLIFAEFGRYETDHDGFGGFQPARSCFDGRYKLVINLLSTDELYDLEVDPAETANLIADPSLSDTRSRLHRELLEWMDRTRDPFRGYYWLDRPWPGAKRERIWSYNGMTRQRENEEYEPRQLDYETGMEMVDATRPK